MKRITIISIILGLAFVAGCSEKGTDSIDSGNPGALIGPSPGIPLGSIMDNYAQNIDTTKVIGNLTLSNLDAFTIDYIDGDTTYKNANNNKATLFIFGPNDSSYSINGSNSINSETMAARTSNSNRYWAHGDFQNQNNLDLNFGSSNTIQIGSTAISSSIDTTINLFNLTDITNIQSGDTISKSTGVTVNWNSTNTDYVNFNIVQSDFPDSLGAEVHNGSCYLQNTGSYTFSASQMQSFPNAWYHITLSNFYPYYLYDNNQNIVIAVAKSKRRITVYLDD